MTSLREAALQALEALMDDCLVKVGPHSWERRSDLAITALKAALADPVQEPVATLYGTLPIYDTAPQTAEPEQKPVALETVYETILHWDEGGGKRSRRELARRIVDLYTAPPQRKPLTIERLRDALVASRIIPPAAVEDPDEYDDGVTLFRIEALHRRIT